MTTLLRKYSTETRGKQRGHGLRDASNAVLENLLRFDLRNAGGTGNFNLNSCLSAIETNTW